MFVLEGLINIAAEISALELLHDVPFIYDVLDLLLTSDGGFTQAFQGIILIVNVISDQLHRAKGALAQISNNLKVIYLEHLRFLLVIFGGKLLE